MGRITLLVKSCVLNFHDSLKGPLGKKLYKFLSVCLRALGPCGPLLKSVSFLV